MFRRVGPIYVNIAAEYSGYLRLELALMESWQGLRLVVPMVERLLPEPAFNAKALPGTHPSLPGA